MFAATRYLQLASGVVLLIYLLFHLVNHALGLASPELAARALHVAAAVWRSTPGTTLLYGAASLHFTLALRTVYTRDHWTMTPAEWLRLWAGFSLPVLLIRHAVATRLAATLYGVDPTYDRVVMQLITSGTQGLQLALLAPGWLHGCLGVWFRLRPYPWAHRIRPALFAFVFALPVLSALGFLSLRHAVLAKGVVVVPVAAQQASLGTWRYDLTAGYIALVVAAFVASRVRRRLTARRVPAA